MKRVESKLRKRGEAIVTFVLILTSFVFATSVFAGGKAEEKAVAPADVAADRESPMLAARVARGELPPVEQRLPLEPKVVQVQDQIGMYGGTWRSAHVGAQVWANEFSGIAGKPNLLSFGMEGAELIPNIAKGWEVVDGGKSVLLFLREGLKWSDGHPFTADDIMFWYEGILLNRELTPGIPGYWMVRGRPVVVRKIDTYTVEWSFNGEVAPHFPFTLAMRGEEPTRAAKHFFEKFHPDYAPADELAKRIADAGFEEWWQLFQMYYETMHWFRPDRRADVPSLYTYIVVEQRPDVTFLERNPYYWKVDPAGNQLPYIDRARVENVADAEVLEAMSVAGQIDYHRGFATSMALYMQSVQDAGNNVLMWTDPQGSRLNASLNHTHQDLVLRELINNPRFKHALSHAINRQELNDLVWLGLGQERQFMVLPPSPYLDPEWETKYTEFDPEKAARILSEEVGLRRDSAGFWLRPDGRRLSLDLEVISVQADWLQGTELIASHWNDFGIEARVRVRSEELHNQRYNANEIDVRMWGERVPPPSVYYNLDGNFVPGLGTHSGIEWVRWVQSDGQAGVEPPDIVKQVMEWREEWFTNPDRAARERAVKNVLAANAEHMWRIGTVGNVPQPMVVSGDLRNAPQEGVWYAWDFAFIGMGRPETWFFGSAERRRE